MNGAQQQILRSVVTGLGIEHVEWAQTGELGVWSKHPPDGSRFVLENFDGQVSQIQHARDAIALLQRQPLLALDLAQDR